MALDKLVDSSQLDTDLTSIANAIRTKGGTSAQLAFPAGFVSAIEAIDSGGGGYTADDIASRNIGGDVELQTTIVKQYAFNATAITSVRSNTVTTVNMHGFSQCSSLLSVDLPAARTFNANAFYNCTNLETLTAHALYSASTNYIFAGCKKLQVIALPSINGGIGANGFDGDTLLHSADFGPSFSSIAGYLFRNTGLTTLVLRRARIAALTNVNAFNGSPFASGGTGGTIYIPKALYDELGTGSSLDYKSATNWSTIDGYGTITWAQIEGSIYETQYADGTPIT